MIQRAERSDIQAMDGLLPFGIPYCRFCRCSCHPKISVQVGVQKIMHQWAIIAAVQCFDMYMLYIYIHMGDSKNRGTPKMDGL